MNGERAQNIEDSIGTGINLDAITILMVEDNPDHELLAKTALERHGFWRIDVARSMAEAFERMRAREYTVLLVDYCLPDGYGLDLLDWVDEDCTVVMMTAQGNEKVAAEAFKRGALDYVVKDTLFREVLPELVSQAVSKNAAIRRSCTESEVDAGDVSRSAVAYSQTIPSLKGYIHTEHLKTALSKVRRHLAEISGCVHVVRYNPDEPVSDNQLGFLESALDNCELMRDLLSQLVRSIEEKTRD